MYKRQRQQFDVAVVTADTLDGKTPMAYADDFYDYNGYGFGESKDGVLLLVSMEDRDWWITTTGYGITAITDAGREYMSERFLPAMSEDVYKRQVCLWGKRPEPGEIRDDRIPVFRGS